MAFALLSFEQGGFPFGIHGGSAQSCAPIRPVSIIWAFLANHFGVAFDLRGGILDQESYSIGEEGRCADRIAALLPVATIAPT